jgi:hypothetical protein
MSNYKRTKYTELFDRFDDFFKQLYALYPKETDFVKYKNKIWMAKSISEREVCDRIAQSLLIFEYEIKNENDKFFLDYPMDDINVLEGHIELIQKLTYIWTTSSSVTKSNIWRYLQIFIALFKKIYNDIQIVYIKLKGLLGLLRADMYRTPVGKVIYTEYMQQINLCQSVDNTVFIIEFSDVLQRHKRTIKLMMSDEQLPNFICFDYTKHHTQHNGFFDWIEQSWSNQNLMFRTTIFKTLLGIIKTSKAIRSRTT